MYKTNNVAITLLILISACSCALGTNKSVSDTIDINNVPLTVPAITEITTQAVTGGPDINSTTISTPPSSTPNTSTTSTTVPTTLTTKVTTPTTTTTTTPSSNPTTLAPTTPSPNGTTPTPNTTTPIPATSVKPTPTPPTTPIPSHRRFDGPSFIGGIVLALGLVAIGFVAFKFYKARTELNYHTL